MKTLAIDFGERRIGLAISDDEARFALPLTTLTRTDDRQAIAEIAAIVDREKIARIVCGEPVGLDGQRGTAARRVAGFAAKLARETGLEVELVNEVLTSREAEHRLREAGIDVRRDPGRIDAVAAQIILEEALARRPPEGER